MVPRVLLGLGRARVARRRGRRPRRGLRLARASTATRPRATRVLGIRHPLALEPRPTSTCGRAGAYRLRGHSIGGFGSVTTNKLVATLVGELFGKHVQAYPRYGSEKKGLPTTYYLTIADAPIRSHAELDQVDFVPLHDVSAFGLGDPLAGLVDGGDALHPVAADATPRPSGPRSRPTARAEIVARGIRVVGARHGARSPRAHAPRPDLLIRMQGVALVGVFLRVAPFARAAGLDRDALLAAVRDAPRPVLRQARRGRRRREPRGHREPPTTASSTSPRRSSAPGASRRSRPEGADR